MDQASFEAELRAAGYHEVALREMAANAVNPEHSHPFDARLLVLDGRGAHLSRRRHLRDGGAAPAFRALGSAGGALSGRPPASRCPVARSTAVAAVLFGRVAAWSARRHTENPAGIALIAGAT
jgi:hypothetical protein